MLPTTMRVSPFSRTTARQYFEENAWLFATGACLLLSLVVAKHGGDFWFHASLIRELADHPWEPQHPIFGGKPHAIFFTPYHVVLAVCVRATGLSAAGVLSAAAWLNAGIWFTGLVRWGRGEGLGNAAWAVLLCCVLVGWVHPWYYAGFFSVAEWPWVMPYPSSLAFGLGLHLLSAYKSCLDIFRWRSVMTTALLAAAILLIHPLTAVAVGLGGLGLTLFSGKKFPSAFAQGAISVVIASLALYLWPYFSWQDLLQPDGAIHTANREMYTRPWLHFLPALLGLLPWAMRVYHKGLDARGGWLLGLMGVYAAGFLLEKWAFGRLSMWAVLILFVEIAVWWQVQAPGWRAGRNWLLVVLAIFSLRYARAWAGWFAPVSKVEMQEAAAISRLLPDHPRVLADPALSEVLPAFGVYVFTYAPGQAVADTSQADAARFFSLSIADQCQLLERIDPDFLVVKAGSDKALANEQWGNWGEVWEQQGGWIVVKKK